MFKKRNKIIYNYIANICTDLKCNVMEKKILKNLKIDFS